MKTVKKFEYAKRNPDVVRQRANARGGDFDSIFKNGVKMFKPREGKNLVRILPPTWENADHYGLEIWINYGIGADDATYLSLSKMKNEPDPIAQARKIAEKEGKQDIVDKLAPKKRVVMWVIDRQAEDEGPQLWSAPWTIDKDICNLSFDEDTREVIMIDDPDEGRDFRFYKEGTGIATKYDSSKMRILKPSRLSEDERTQDEWLTFVQNNPLPECLQFYDFEHIASVFDGFVGKPENGKAKDASKPKVNQDADEDDPKPKLKVVPPPPEDPEDDEISVSQIKKRLEARRSVKPPSNDDDE